MADTKQGVNMMYNMGFSKGLVPLLVAMAVGYFVCVKADEKQGFVKSLGYWIGSIIIVISILVSLSGLCSKICHKSPGSYMPHRSCPMMHK